MKESPHPGKSWSKDGQSALIWSQLEFEPWSFDGSDRLLEILRWRLSFEWLLEFFLMKLLFGLALILLGWIVLSDE